MIKSSKSKNTTSKSSSYVLEEGVRFKAGKGIFYNPNMRSCRSISSLAVGAIEDDLEVIDAFCASGIRGIRYGVENDSVGKITFIDLSKTAIAAAKKNAKSNKLQFEAKIGDVCKLSFETSGNFVELDPFGTPSPYLFDSMRFVQDKKRAYLSITATDVAVLCGGLKRACLKNYHSRPMNNEFTHETGLRILMKRAIEIASEFNFGSTPLVSFSNLHYLKTIIRLDRSADKAGESLNLFGYICHCKSCGNRFKTEFPALCNFCNAKTEYAGPLWLGELHEQDFIDRMIAFNNKRKYCDKVDLGRMLELMRHEVGLPPFYYNLHDLSKIVKRGSVPKTADVISCLSSGSFRAFRTHFSPISIKTDAPYELVLDAVRKS